MRKLLLSLVGLAILAGSATACSTSTPPPNATAVLVSDGYTPMTKAAVTRLGIVMPAAVQPYISSWAAGTGSAGLEVVAVLTAAGEVKISGQNLALSGATATVHGDILRIDGSW
jgi:hypothetical protein